MVYNIEYAYTSNIGKVRKNHEDNFWCDGDFLPAVNSGMEGVTSGIIKAEEIPAFAVFDGMGGESCGEMAAAAAAEAFDTYYQDNRKDFADDPRMFLLELGKYMNSRVCGYASDHNIISMGSTAASVLFGRDWYAASNLGDSRIYVCRKGKLEQVSTDHVFMGGNFRKAPLVQYLGLEESDGVLEPSFVRGNLEEGLRILLCSDGVTDMITDEELCKMLSAEEGIAEITGAVLEKALENGGRDNTTLILLQAVPGEENAKEGFFSRLFGSFFGGRKSS